MTPTLALLLWIVLILCLLYFDPAKDKRVSSAVWIPLIWLFIIGSRLPSQWIGMASTTGAAEEGNSFDRAIYLLLITLAAGVVLSRPIKWGTLIRQNLALAGFILFGLFSVIWADYPFIAFKRWFRDLGICLALFVVLSDAHPKEAVVTLLRRLCFLVISLSVLLVKYFPDMARQYDFWSGVGYYVGVTTSKNMLGVACLVSGLFFFWDSIDRWPHRSEGNNGRAILVNALFIATSLWLLDLADSATSRFCLGLGALVLLATKSRRIMRYPLVLTAGIPAMIGLYLLLEFSFGIDVKAEVIRALGRNPNLTGRTEIWAAVLKLAGNPLIGVGYECFWVGPRPIAVGDLTGMYGLNESHNGYLEVYAGLGLSGLLILLTFLGASYSSICRGLTEPLGFGSLNLAIWTILLFYNVTESSFRISQFLFVTFLLTTTVVPTNRRTNEEVANTIRASLKEKRETNGRHGDRDLGHGPFIGPTSGDWWVGRQ